MNTELVTKEESTVVMAEPHMRLIEIAVSGGADIEKIEKLMNLQERYEAAQAKKEFNKAMAVFQGELPVIEKLGIVDFESSKGRTYYNYAKLEDIAKAIRPALKSADLAYRFAQKQDAGLMSVRCIVTHKDGHSEFSEISSSLDTTGGKDALKSIASTISYLKRYTLTGVLGVVVGGEDDDGGQNNENSTVSGGDFVEGITACYPDEEFNKNFPTWEKAIKTGKKTVDSLHSYLNGKNIIISKEQYSKLSKVEVN